MSMKFMNKLNYVSVITVCYNCVDKLRQTITSVIGQDSRQLEYIVIDGASTDGTVEMINDYRDVIHFFLSEKDTGIYDAMNKGIKVATGDWIIFMNAGDCFHDSHVITEFLRIANNDYDIIYGSIIKMLPDIHYRYDPYPIEMMERCMPLPHQGTFIKTSFQKSHLFDTSYKSSGDYHFFYNAYFKYGAKFKQIDLIVADFDESEGMSKNNIKTARLEDLRIWGKEHDVLSFLYIWLRIFYWRVTKFAESFLSDSLNRRWRNYKLKRQGYHLINNKA